MDRAGIGAGVGLAVLLGSLGTGVAMAEGTHRGYEMPAYAVERVDGAREVRAYGPRTVAEVTVAGEQRAAIETGFRVLASYIFGGNETGEKIAMTVPVDQADQSKRADGAGGVWTIRFTMPLDTVTKGLPAPKDGRIALRALPPGRMVAETFSGRPDGADLARRAQALADWARGQGLTPEGGPVYSFYDGPWSLPWTRRNEVAFRLR